MWWLPGAVERLAQGKRVEPLYEKTIDEQRANDLFRWFRDFGDRFGWRQTSTLTKLQEAANLGGIGIIVARRKLEGRSGHIVVAVPETNGEKAKRNRLGEVTAPLQSQAGSVNFGPARVGRSGGKENNSPTARFGFTPNLCPPKLSSGPDAMFDVGAAPRGRNFFAASLNFLSISLGCFNPLGLR